MNNKVAIFLASGFEVSEAVITIDLLRRAEIEVDVVSISRDLLVKSNHNLEVKSEKLIDDIDFSEYKVLILPGGAVGVNNLNKNELLKTKLTEFANSKDKLIAAICAAPQILGQLNLLDYKKVTFYPGCTKGLDKAIKAGSEPVVSTNNIITAKSIGTAFQFGLEIVKILKGQESFDLLKKELEF